jgi:hypothetical protein
MVGIDRERPSVRCATRRKIMKKIILAVVAVALGFSTGVYAHTLRIECKKTTGDTIVCRGVFSDGELARRLAVILVDDEEKVLSSGKTDVKGEYTFTAPGPVAGFPPAVLLAMSAFAVPRASV